MVDQPTEEPSDWFALAIDIADEVVVDCAVPVDRFVEPCVPAETACEDADEMPVASDVIADDVVVDCATAVDRFAEACVPAETALESAVEPALEDAAAGDLMP